VTFIPAAADIGIGETMNINQAGLDLIKEFEGFRADTYRCSGGVLTIGYGTTGAAGVGIDPKPGMRITEAQAEQFLRLTLDKFGASIRPAMTREPSANEWAAMLSLAYNIGPGAFRSSSVLRLFNAGDTAGAADAFLRWNKAKGKILRGLTRRREAERALFLTPISPAPRLGAIATIIATIRQMFREN
jgi:lysozyme